MITLRPTSAIFDPQSFSESFMQQVTRQEDPWLTTTLAWQDLRRYYFNPDGAGKDEGLRSLLAEIPPHLARTLQRQQTLTAFYDTYWRRLEAAGVRVVPLEDRHPVGRYLVPTEALTTALAILDRSICLDLLSVNAVDLGLDDAYAMTELADADLLVPSASHAPGEPGETPSQQAALRAFLCSYLPRSWWAPHSS